MCVFRSCWVVASVPSESGSGNRVQGSSLTELCKLLGEVRHGAKTEGSLMGRKTYVKLVFWIWGNPVYTLSSIHRKGMCP